MFQNKKIRNICLCILLTIVVTVGGFGIYVSDYYKADTANIEAFLQGTQVRTFTDKKVTVYGEEDCENGFIFYQGGKVESKAYEPLMCKIAMQGVLCVVVEMPFNLAVLNMNGADGICERYESVTNWYIGGHSLGGAMASCYVAKNAEDFEGLILLGAYSSEDLSKTNLRVLSLYGSEDKVLNKEKYDEYKPNLPFETAEIVIQGGCHAYFGMYGEQKGDGTPTITAEEQIGKTSTYIVEFMNEGEN